MKMGVGSWTTNELREYFSKFGRVKSSRVVFDQKTGWSKGYGFVAFTSPASVQTVFQEESHVIDGRRARALVVERIAHGQHGYIGQYFANWFPKQVAVEKMTNSTRAGQSSMSDMSDSEDLMRGDTS